MPTDMDLESFNLGRRLKRLQHTAKQLRFRTTRLSVVKNHSMEKSGEKDAIAVEVDLRYAKPGSTSKRDLDTLLEKSQGKLLEVALSVINCLEEEIVENKKIMIEKINEIYDE